VNLIAQDHRPDRVAARATGLGIGLIAFMLTWTIGARATTSVLEAPANAYVAMFIAIVVGVAVTLLAGRRLQAAVPPVASID